MEDKIKNNIIDQIGYYKGLENRIIEGLGIDEHLKITNLELSEELKKLINKRNEVQERVFKILGVK